jgi:hypothetical protein
LNVALLDGSSFMLQLQAITATSAVLLMLVNGLLLYYVGTGVVSVLVY